MKIHTLVMFGLLVGGCGERTASPESREVGDTLPISVLADSAAGASLPPVRVGPGQEGPRLTLVRIAPLRSDVNAPLPVPEPAALEESEPRAPEASRDDDELRPPIPRGPAIVRLSGARAGWLELDVRVDENGEVTDAIAVGGDADSATVRAATESALAMRWFPAVRRGRPVAVWCRQRFETGPARN
jgi:hypothetical protein